MQTVRKYAAHHIFCQLTASTLMILASFNYSWRAEAQGIPNQSLADLILQQKIVSPKQSIKAIVTQTSATLTTERLEKDDDNACKLRAILMAKCVFESQPSSIQKTIVVFLNYKTNAADTATIKRAEIDEFGAGKLSESALLASIDFDKTGGSDGKSTVVNGDLQAQREILLDRITRMKAKGTNVTAFMNIFNEIEQLAQSDDKTKLKERFDYLTDKVSEQERMVREAQSTAHITLYPSGSIPGRQGAGAPADNDQVASGTFAPKLPKDLSDCLVAAGLGDPGVVTLLAKYRGMLMVVGKTQEVNKLDDVIRTRSADAIMNYMGTLKQKK